MKLYDNGIVDHIKIADFGLSRHLAPPGEMGTFCGTPSHVAPEIVKMQGYSSKADVFSFGIILWEFAMERRPYKDLRGMACAWEVANGRRPEIPKEGDCPTGLVEIMTACWQQEPEERPSFKEVMAQLHKLMGAEKKLALHQQELAKQCNILSKAEMFDGMPESMVDHVVEKMELVNYREGETICRQGDEGDAMYIIMDGKVDIYIRKHRSDALHDEGDNNGDNTTGTMDDKVVRDEVGAKNIEGDNNGDNTTGTMDDKIVRDEVGAKNIGEEKNNDQAPGSATSTTAADAAAVPPTNEESVEIDEVTKVKESKRSKGTKTKGGLEDYGKKVREMKGIDFFGELALTSVDNIRTATALCATRVKVGQYILHIWLIESEARSPAPSISFLPSHAFVLY